MNQRPAATVPPGQGSRHPAAIAPPRRRPRRPAAVLAAGLLLLLGAAGPAVAEWVPQYFLFDRAAWSPDSRSAGLVGRFRNEKTGETFEDTLVIEVNTGRVACVSPTMNGFVMSRDGRRLLGLGRWGLFTHDVPAGVTRELLAVDPFKPVEIAAYSYNLAGDAAVCIRCSDLDPDISGVHSFPLDGGEPTRLLADARCAEQSLNYWQTHRREVGAVAGNIPRLGKGTVIPNFPGTVWRVKAAGKDAVAVWGNGAAADDTLCVDCQVAFVSWPAAGGRAILSTLPENIRDLTTPGNLWLLRPAEPPHLLGRGHFLLAEWPDSDYAFVLARPGRLWVADGAERGLRQLDMSVVPSWLKRAAPAPAPVWTIRLAGESFPDPDSARAAALALRDAVGQGYALDPVAAGSPVGLCVGAFADSGQALAAARSLARRRGWSGRALSPRVERRPVATMQGQFDFGPLLSPDGQWRLFFRSHPHLFRPYMASEVWLEPAGGGRRRQLLGAMANF